ncbi:MAG: FAD:protein FMN transferase [Defluviitaleaceae bacterium]|nr:FAD:protein FMN transferase [Defluviitaleaceae bacterium]
MVAGCVSAALLLLSACSPSDTSGQLTRFQAGFIGTFDTYIQVLIYAETRAEFGEHFDSVRDLFEHYHALFDIFNEHEGINNLWTVNSSAGREAVAVDPAIIELLLASRQAYADTGGALNIALGAVLSIWHEYRSYGRLNPDEAVVPAYSALRAASLSTNIQNMIIDEQAGTVFLADPDMSLDVGAVAKSFAAGRAADKLRERGVVSAVIDAGGDIAIIGNALASGGRPWSIGVRHPLQDGNIDTMRVTDVSAATSGDYQRAFVVGGVTYNHIIDPSTLMPAVRFASVSVAHSDIMVAEILSTALFIKPFDEGLALADRLGAAVIWVEHDGTVHFNEAYRDISANFGG